MELNLLVEYSCFHGKIDFHENGLKKKPITYKMEKLRVQKLKAMAKERGLKGYSKLRKAELINMLGAPTPRPSKMISVINDYVKPTLAEVKKAFDWTKNKVMDLRDFINKRLNDLIDWAKKPSVPREKPSLSNYVKEELKESKICSEEVCDTI